MWDIPREENAPFHVALLYKLHVAHGILGQMWVGIGQDIYRKVKSPFMHWALAYQLQVGVCGWVPLTSDGRFQLNVRNECTIFALDYPTTVQWTQCTF